MSKRPGQKDGSGRSISFVFFPIEETETSSVVSTAAYAGTSCRGLQSKTDGTVEVRLTEMDDSIFINVVAGAKELYSIDTILEGGDIPLTDIMLFW